MSRNLSAEKSDRQGRKRRLRNRMVKSRAKSMVKDYVGLVQEKKKPEAQRKLVELTSYLQKAVGKGVYHRSTAARTISRMSRLIATLGS